MTMRACASWMLGAAVATTSCSGQYQVGTEPGAGGSSGQTGSAGSMGSAGSGGGGGASGQTSSAVTTGGGNASSASTTGTAGAGGGTSVGAGGMGQGGSGNTSRCGFAIDLSTPGPTAATTVVVSRIGRFLDDNPSLSPGLNAPVQATPDYAGAFAMSVLDGHAANGTEARGLVRFLGNWLGIPAADAGTSVARTWAAKLVDPSATLSTLLAGPTADPRRIGILTDRQFLTRYPTITQRGTWMAGNLWCMSVPPPPAGLAPPGPPIPGATRREWLANEVKDASCQGCHQLTDPPGFSLEHFDAQGTYRDLDSGKPVDSSGTIQNPMLSFSGIETLAPQLGVSCPVAQCFSQRLMADAFGASVAANRPFTDEELNHVANIFADSNFSIRTLVKAIVTSPAFLR